MSNQCGCNHWTKPVCPEISCSWNEWKAQQNLAARKAQRKPMTDVIKAAQGVLEWTEIAHRPPKRDRLEAGRMAMVRLHALADLHDALTAHSIKEQP